MIAAMANFLKYDVYDLELTQVKILWVLWRFLCRSRKDHLHEQPTETSQ
jgi:hypothetical protein